MSRLNVGDRVAVTDWADQHFGREGTVTRGEYAGVLTGRPMVELLVDGQQFDDGYYVEQLEPLHVLAAA